MITIQRLLTAAFVFAALLLSAASVAARERPSVTGFSVSPSRFTVAQPPARPSPASGRGAAIRFQLSKPAARLRIAFARGLAGRRAAGRCVKPTSRLRARRACTRWNYIGVIRRQNVDEGDGRLLFRGRLKGPGSSPGRTARRSSSSTGGAVRAPVRPTRSGSRAAAAVAGAAAVGQVPGDFPNEATTGVPPGWVPRETRSSSMSVNNAGAVVEDVLLTNGADLNINAPNVTIRRFKIEGGAHHDVRSRRPDRGHDDRPHRAGDQRRRGRHQLLRLHRPARRDPGPQRRIPRGLRGPDEDRALVPPHQAEPTSMPRRREADPGTATAFRATPAETCT